MPVLVPMVGALGEGVGTGPAVVSGLTPREDGCAAVGVSVGEVKSAVFGPSSDRVVGPSGPGWPGRGGPAGAAPAGGRCD